MTNVYHVVFSAANLVRKVGVFAIALVGSVAFAGSGESVLQNGGFETDTTSVSAGGWQYMPSGARTANWVNDGYAVLVSWSEKSTWLRAGQSLDGGGSYLAGIQRVAKLSNTFTVPKGGDYRVSFFYAGRMSTFAHSLIVDVDGVTREIPVVSQQFEKYEFTLHLDAGSHKLTFSNSYTEDKDPTTLFDNVSVTRIGQGLVVTLE